MTILSVRLLILFHFMISLLYAGSSPKVINAVRTNEPPFLDGLINEPQWQMAPPVDDFTQFDPKEGALPTEITSVRILYDNRAVYVGVICYDSKPRQIVRQLSRRDRNTEADRFTVIIDSYYDRQTAFVFSANVSGVQSDGVLSQDGTIYDVTWDAVWSVKTRTHPQGWSAEFEIPYNALRFSKQERNVYEWGINFRRYISRKHETDEWVMVPRKDAFPGTISSVSRMGQLIGISSIDPPLHLSLIPFVSGKSTFQTAIVARSNSVEHVGTAGLDVKYGLTRNFTLDATINPDFGQVEVDQAVLNLTVFETRFPEKRPFFIEGAQVFTFGSSVDNTPLSLFFSRRIGKRPSGSPFVSAPVRGTIEENPQVTTILGAAKISGRSNSGFSLGVVTAATDEETAIIKDAAGNQTSQRTEPRGSYNVVRVKQDMEGGSWVGATATLASRENTLPAFSGGVDWNLRLGEGTYTVDGYIAGARSSLKTVRRNGSGGREGAAGRLLFSRIAAEHWLYTGSFDFYTRYFNSNDLGFFAQPHDYGSYVQLIYQENFATGIFRRYAMSVVPEYRWNWDGILTRALVEASFTGEFTNFWRPVFKYDFSLPSYDDEERGIIGTYKRPIAHSFQAQIKTDERSNLSATLTAGYSLDHKKKRSVTASLGLTIRPASWTELTPLVFYQRTRREEAWLFPDGNIVDTAAALTAFSVFGDRAVDELDVALRGIITFTRSLSLQFYSQVLLARGKYDNYKRLTGSSDPVSYDYRSFSGFRSHDFNDISFNANVLLRWEYLPGSTIYFVWTQGRSGDSGNYSTGFGQRFGDAFALPHEDVLLLKVSYWLSL